MKARFILFLVLCGVVNTHAGNSSLGKAYRQAARGNYYAATTEAERQVKLHPHSAKVWYGKGFVYEKLSFQNESLYDTDSMLEVSVESYIRCLSLSIKETRFARSSRQRLNSLWKTCIHVGNQRYHSGEYDSAISIYKVAQIIRPYDTTAFLYAAHAAHLSKDTAEEARNYLQLITLGWQHAEAYLTVSLCYIHQYKTDSALAVLNSGLKKYPGDKHLLMYKTEALKRAHMWDSVYCVMDCRIKQEEDNALLYFEKAEYLYAAGLYTDAIAYYRMTLSIDPDMKQAWYNLGLVNYKLGVGLLSDIQAMNLTERKTKANTMKNAAKDYMNMSQKCFETFFSLEKENTGDAQKYIKDIQARLATF